MARKEKIKKDTQSRGWLFTVNNPKLSDDDFYKYLKGINGYEYFSFCREQGTTIHHQAYIEFVSPRPFSTVKNMFSKKTIKVDAHIETRKGSKTQAHDYVKKIGKYADKADTQIGEIFEDGELIIKGQGHRTDLDTYYEKIKEGATDFELLENPETRKQFARMDKLPDRVRSAIAKNEYTKKIRNMEVYYYYGNGDAMQYVYDKYGIENVYRFIDYVGQRFDDYDGQDIICFDWFIDKIDLRMMCAYLEGKPLTLKPAFKGIFAKYTKVYILADKELERQYKWDRENENNTNAWFKFKSLINEVKEYSTSGFNEQQKIKLDSLKPVDDGDLPF